MNNRIPQLLVCDIEFAICNHTSSMLSTKLHVSVPFGFSGFIACLKVPERLDNDDFLLLLPPLFTSSPRK